MIKKITGVLFALVVVFVVIVALQPSEFRITRNAAMSVPPEQIFAHVNDFHKWQAWSPWAKLDPAAKNTFEGPASGPGAVFKWTGNNEVGEGSMAIVESRPNELIRIQLDFIKPFQATNQVEFIFIPGRNQTRVEWSMSGKNNFMGKAIGLVMNCDKMVGGMYEKGLADLKGLVEGTPNP